MATRLNRQHTDWEKIFASYSSDEELVIRKYRKIKKLNSQRINDPMKKWANELTESFQRKKSKWPKKRKNAQHPWP
jgi:hypothetical protein